MLKRFRITLHMAVLSNTQDISKADNSLNLFVFPVNSYSDRLYI